MNDRYWILDNPDPEDLSGYVAIVDEEEGGILLYVVAHRAENVLRRLTRIGGGQ